MKKKTTHPNYWTEFSHLLPRKWSRIGHPIPVPGGFVFIVGVTVLGRRQYALNRYQPSENDQSVFAPVLDDMGRAIILRDPQMARRMLVERAQHIEGDEE